jgi:septal ring factor EnvC (AmiA/AmiB activator)
MVFRPTDTSRRIDRRWILLSFALLLACVSLLSLPTAGAPAADLAAKLHQKQDQLSNVQDQQASVATTIAESNREVDSLIGQVAEARSRAAAVRAQLERKQAEFDRAKAKLASERRHLKVVRAHLRRAKAALAKELVAIYKSEDPDTLSVILDSSSWSDVVASSEYLNSFESYGQRIVIRVKQLRNQVRAAVAEMRAARDRIRTARDAIAAQKRQIDATRAALDSRMSQLRAARAARQHQLDGLEGQAQALQDNLASITSQIQAQAQAPAAAPSQPAPLAPGDHAQLLSNGDAAAPANAPAAVKGVIAAANQINDLPYVWGGGHGSFQSSGYDCSGSVSFALNGGGLLSSPLDSTGLETWGVPGGGSWITVYANSGHAFAVIAGLRWDTVGDTSGTGPRWHTDMVSTGGFIARHPSGL